MSNKDYRWKFGGKDGATATIEAPEELEVSEGEKSEQLYFIYADGFKKAELASFAKWLVKFCRTKLGEP